MFKYLLLILLFSYNNSFGQEYPINKKEDTIPLFDNNRSFITMVNREYDKLVKVRADSILLYYELNFESNYAVIFWKKKGISQSIAFYQYNPPKQVMGKEILKNAILRKINMKRIWDILQNNEVRTIDTTGFTSEVYPVYCRFYFGNKMELNAGYDGKISMIIGTDFMNAYAAEQGRIVNRELKKSGVQRMSF